MGQRRQGRELALQMLFQSDMGKQSIAEVRNTFWTERTNVDDETHGFADDLFRMAFDRQPEIDALIEKHAAHWRMHRMAAIDRNLLRTAVAEFLGYPKTPKVIVINEALEMAHKYSAPESVNFLNGVLDAVAKDVPRTA